METVGKIKERRPQRRFEGSLQKYLVGAAIAVILIATISYLVSSGSRSYVLSALTRGLELTFGNDIGNAWHLADATVCTLKGALPRRPDPSNKDYVCDPNAFDIEVGKTAELAWPEGTTVSISRAADDLIQITVLGVQDPKLQPNFDGISLSRGSLIILTENGFRKSAPMPFVGYLTLGLGAGPGKQADLVSGYYEVRETLPVRSKPEKVGVGDFIPGDSVVFIARCAGNGVDNKRRECLPKQSRRDQMSDMFPAVVQGFIGAALDGEKAFRTVAYVPSGQTIMRINRRALEPADIVPSWTDRAINDPWLIGFAAILGLLGALKGTIVDWPLLFIEGHDDGHQNSRVAEANWPRTHPITEADKKAVDNPDDSGHTS